MNINKPRIILAGRDGDAFAILGRCRKAASGAGWSKERMNAFHAQATSGDYDHLLRTVLDHFDNAYDDDNDDNDDNE